VGKKAILKNTHDFHSKPFPTASKQKFGLASTGFALFHWSHLKKGIFAKLHNMTNSLIHFIFANHV
jgi:hypothetical protein